MDVQSNIVDKSDHREAKPTEGGFVYSVWHLRSDIQYRWKRNIIILLVLGVLVSLVLHLFIAFLLDLYGKNAGLGEGSGESTVIEFAIFESETLSELPESTEIESSDAAPTALDSPLTAETVLEATSSTSELIADQSIVPTLGGSLGGDLGAGIGGSGGGGGASFFGISSEGGRFCYIMDISASMNQDNRLQGATKELQASLLKLTNFSQFYVLFYSSGVTEPPTQHGWNTARRSTLTRINNEIQRVKAYGGTLPTPAFKKAMELNPLPDVIFFLTDGHIPSTVIGELRNMLPTSQRIVIHTVAFGKSADTKQLKEIATLTGGQFKFVKSGGAP